jgi:hypothetical protein
MESNERITINKVDQSRPLAEWKPLLADFGRRRHLSYTMDFDNRASVFEEPGEGWIEEARRLQLTNRDRIKAGLEREFGSDCLDNKIASHFPFFPIIMNFLTKCADPLSLDPITRPLSAHARLANEF